jgi:hypothetical protein
MLGLPYLSPDNTAYIILSLHTMMATDAISPGYDYPPAGLDNNLFDYEN